MAPLARRSGRNTVLRRQSGSVAALALGPDGKLIASAGLRGAIWLTQVANASSRVLRGHDGSVTRLVFFGDGRMLASAARDGTMRLWGLEDGREAVVRGDGSTILALGLAPDGRRMATGDSDGTIRQWKVPGIHFVPGGGNGDRLRHWLDAATDFTIIDDDARDE